MEKFCKTCRYDQWEGSTTCARYCNSEYSGWEPKAVKYTEKEIPGLNYPWVAGRSSSPLSDTQKKISEICDEVKTILLEKNRKYGDSALNPKRVFSKASPIEQINVRIDDKISRIMSAQDDDTEDAELDLIGYLILKRVAKKVLHDVQ